MQNEELKPCPFCKTESQFVEVKGSAKTSWYVQCMNPNCWVMTGLIYKDKALAAKTWNTRSPLLLEGELPAIDYDETMDRYYIPVANWEVQTKGKGSSFRIANRVTGARILVTDERLHGVLESMARDAHAAILGEKGK